MTDTMPALAEEAYRRVAQKLACAGQPDVSDEQLDKEVAEALAGDWYRAFVDTLWFSRVAAGPRPVALDPALVEKALRAMFEVQERQAAKEEDYVPMTPEDDDRDVAEALQNAEFMAALGGIWDYLAGQLPQS